MNTLKCNLKFRRATEIFKKNEGVQLCPPAVRRLIQRSNAIAFISSFKVFAEDWLIHILIRRFHNCSKPVKVLLFKSFCLYLYGLSVWKSFSATCIGRNKTAFHKFIKNFFRFARCDSVTGILADLGLPSFDTILWNAKQTFIAQRNNCVNGLVAHISLVSKY